jgi:2,3,4,5-tetrahydropyridine-2,6-dicarboxylate N-succinyltransferase
MLAYQTLIEAYFEKRQEISPTQCPAELSHALEAILDALDQGTLRTAEKIQGTWQIHTWVKKAILLCFKRYPNHIMPGPVSDFYDKIDLKFRGYTEKEFLDQGIRVVPQATVRRGAFIGKNTVLMPSFVNIGAYIDTGVMVDTWATVGSCAQIGKNVHLSGGVGIGGVLEPLQAQPTIIEDHCFIGARSEIVEGVIVEEGAVIAMGVFIGQSTKIYHRETGEITYGRVPAGSVVVAGSLPSQDKSHHLYCAVIVKQVDEKTREKVGINALLRDITP